MKSAKENGYRGSIITRKSSGDVNAAGAGKLFIIYTPKASGLEDVGSAAAAGTGTKLMGNF